MDARGSWELGVGGREPAAGSAEVNGTRTGYHLYTGLEYTPFPAPSP
jgi:hypothetical protein